MAGQAKENMKSDSFDYIYTTGKNGNGLIDQIDNSSKKNYYDSKLTEQIEVLIKALGTMVLINEYHTNPNTLKREHLGAVQQPILLDDKRELVLNKLTELISKL